MVGWFSNLNILFAENWRLKRQFRFPQIPILICLLKPKADQENPRFWHSSVSTVFRITNTVCVNTMPIQLKWFYQLRKIKPVKFVGRRQIWKVKIELIPPRADLLGEPHFVNCKESGSDLESEINPGDGNGFWTSERILCINEYLLNKKESIYILCCDNSFRGFWHPISQVVSWSDIEINCAGRPESVLVLVGCDCECCVHHKTLRPYQTNGATLPAWPNWDKYAQSFIYIQDSEKTCYEIIFYSWTEGWT